MKALLYNNKRQYIEKNELKEINTKEKKKSQDDFCEFWVYRLLDVFKPKKK